MLYVLQWYLPQTYEVTLGRKYGRFTAQAGVLDTAAGRYKVEVTLDQQAPIAYIAEPGNIAKIDLAVNNVNRMRLQLYSAFPLKSPLAAGADTTVGRNGARLPGLALANPLLLP